MKATKEDIKFTRANRQKSFHKFEVPCIITESEAVELQKEYGYHPAGYGFYNHETNKDITTWECSASCD